MRLSFANGEHADVVVDEGAASLGNAEGNTVVLSGRDVAAWHARLTVDERGIVLHVLDPTARTHVNARPVREKALLRCGDMLCLGKVMIALKADRDDLIDSRVPAETAVPPASYPPRVLLRGVSGSHFGKAIAVNRRLTIGRERGCDLVLDETRVAPRHATIEHVGDAIYLRETGPTEGTAVNGVRVSAAVVHPGDQLTFGHSHFIVEAPGLPPRGDAGAAHAITEQFEAVGDEDANPPPPRAQGAIWWLIGAAALIALGLGLLLHRGF
jgi:pSer/pThr/pTyr-binding forkhead associated (FHA) protein